MGAPKTKTVGGGADTQTAQNWNGWLGNQMQAGGGFNTTMNNLMGNQGYQTYQNYFNQQSNGGIQGGVPSISSNFSAPNYNSPAALGGFQGGQNAQTNFQNPGLNQQIGSLYHNANQTNLSGLGGLAGMFMNGYAQHPQMQMPQSQPVQNTQQQFQQPNISKDQYGGIWNNGAYSSPWGADHRMSAGSTSFQQGSPFYQQAQDFQANTDPNKFKVNYSPEQIAQINQSRKQLGYPDTALISSDGNDPTKDPAVAQYYSQLTNPMPPQGAGGFNPQAQSSQQPQMGMPQGLSQLPQYSQNPAFQQFLAQGLGQNSQFAPSQGMNFNVNSIQTPNLNVNSQYAQDMSGLLEKQAQTGQMDLLDRLSASGMPLSGSSSAQQLGLMQQQTLPAIAQARASANALQGQMQQGTDIQNQNAQLQGLGLQSSYNTQNRGLDLGALMQGRGLDLQQLGLVNQNQMQQNQLGADQRNVDANNQTQLQLGGLNAALSAAGLNLQQNNSLNNLMLSQADLANQANNSANQNYLSAIGMNNQFAGMQNNYNLNNAQMQNSFLGQLNQLMSGDNQFGANLNYQSQYANANNQLQNQSLMNQYGLGMGNLGLGLTGQYNSNQQNILNQLFGSYQQANQIGTPQAQTVQTPSTFGQMMQGLGGLVNIGAGLFGQNGMFPNVFGGGGGGMTPNFGGLTPPGIGMTPSAGGPYSSGWSLHGPVTSGQIPGFYNPYGG